MVAHKSAEASPGVLNGRLDDLRLRWFGLRQPRHQDQDVDRVEIGIIHGLFCGIASYL